MNKAIEECDVPEAGFSVVTSRFHRVLARLLVMHQEALLLDDLVLALNVFDLFVEALQRHLDVENNLLLPLHHSLVVDYRWPVLVYEKEHDKMLQMAARIRRDLVALPALQRRARRLALLEVLDYQRSFKSVMQHHEEREEQALLVELDDWPDSEAYQQVYAQIGTVWQQYLAEIEPRLQTLDACLC